MCFCIIICIECPFGSIRHCKTHPYVWNGLPSPPNVPFFGDLRFICTKSPMIFPCNHVSGLNSQCLLVKSHVVLGKIHPFFVGVQVATLEQSLGLLGKILTGNHRFSHEDHGVFRLKCFLYKAIH
jgi:hypothetical protein